MDWLHAAVLAVVQGLTEFLPISSSAHLILPSQILEWPDQGLAFDVAVHLGTLLAVMFYYRADLANFVVALYRWVLKREVSDDSRMIGYLFIATLPVCIVGYIGESYIEAHFRTIAMIASTTIVFGLLLGLADWRNKVQATHLRKLTITLAVLIGLSQVLALIPGVSRSGITITAALFLGVDRHLAARFSFLLSIPVILAAGTLKGAELSQAATPVDIMPMVLGIVLSAFTAYVSIAWFIRLLDRIGMMPFVYYRLVLGLILYVIN